MSKTEKTQDESHLEEALSPIVNRLIDKNYETSQDKIASQMAPLIGSAIREQIKSQKDDVVDALYPVLGNMISRYVTKTLEDMLEKINSQIQNGLSFSALKRKATAKIKGVSESELLLNENASANIRALLLIHKETGIVLAHSENPKHPVSEPEMLASMITAIRSFVNDWVDQNSEHQELGEIEYGGNKIILEASGYAYLAVIVEGSAYKATYDKIRTTLEQIVLKHGESIRSFDGDLSKFSNLEIYREIGSLLQEKPQQKSKKKMHPLMFLIPLALLAWGTYSYYKSYISSQLLNSVQERLYRTPQLTSYRIDAVIDENKNITLSGEVPFTYHKQLAQKSVSDIEGLQGITNNIIVVESFKDPMQTSANIAYLLAGLNNANAINITYEYDFDTLTLKGSVWSQSYKTQVLKLLAKIKEIKNIVDTMKIVPPKIATTIYFEKGSTKLTQEATNALINAIIVLQELDKKTQLSLTSYSDMIGSAGHNQYLSQKRVHAVEKFLQTQGVLQESIFTQSFNTPPKEINASKTPELARCVILNYTKEEK